MSSRSLGPVPKTYAQLRDAVTAVVIEGRSAIELVLGFTRDLRHRLRRLDCPDGARSAEMVNAQRWPGAAAEDARHRVPSGRGLAQLATAAGRAAKAFVEKLLSPGDEVIVCTTKTDGARQRVDGQAAGAARSPDTGGG